MELISDQDPRLYVKSGPLNPRDPGFDLSLTVNEMIQLMRDSKGVGLAAPQVGINRRFFVLEVEGKTYVCVNPRVVKAMPQTQTVPEGCLSFPGLQIPIQRATTIKVEYQEVSGLKRTKTFRGLLARAFLHELDHLNGIVLTHYTEKDEDGPVERRGLPL